MKCVTLSRVHALSPIEGTISPVTAACKGRLGVIAQYVPMGSDFSSPLSIEQYHYTYQLHLLGPETTSICQTPST